MINNKIVYVKWYDSSSHDRWLTNTEIDKSLLGCISIGFLVAETKDAIIISGHKTEATEPQFSGAMTIPKKAVAQIKKIIL